MNPEKFSKTDNDKLVHESEVQRQFVRVEIPCLCSVNKENFRVADISVGGIQINTDRSFDPSERLNIKILFPLKNSAFHTRLEAKQIYFDKERKKAGLQFVSLKNKDIALIRYMVQNYLSGHLATEGDVVNIVSREGLTAPRAQIGNDNTSLPKWKRMLPMAAILAGGLAGLLLIGSNIYENTAILKSYMSTVTAEKFTIRAENNGIFYSLISDGTQAVTEGQPIAVIKKTGFTGPGSNAPAESDPVLKSPCNCKITGSFAMEGEFKAIGEPIYQLLPLDGDVWITAAVDPSQAHRLKIYDDVKIRIAGESEFIEGSVTAFLPAEKGDQMPKVKVEPLEKISPDLVDRPAYLEFILN